MAVSFDNSAQTASVNVTTLTTPTFTIGGSNRAAMMFLQWTSPSAISITASVGGVSAVAVAGTDTSGAFTCRSRIVRVLNPPAGSQTATVSWTNAINGFLGVITASGVDQTTPVNNGTANGNNSTSSQILSVTSSSGDLSAAAVIDLNASLDMTISTIVGTEKYNALNGSNIRNHAGAIGSGVGTVAHEWSFANTGSCSCTGANFVAAAADPDVNITLSGIKPISQKNNGLTGIKVEGISNIRRRR